MIRARLVTLAAGLTVFATSALSAQTIVAVNVTSNHAAGDVAVNFMGFDMSPFEGTVAGDAARLDCVDFYHRVVLGSAFSATRVNLGDAILDNSIMSFTREGSNGYYTNMLDVLHVYEKAAWLSTQIALMPSSDIVNTEAIQTAIWAIVDKLPAVPPTGAHIYSGTAGVPVVGNFVTPTPNTTGYWIAAAEANYSLQSLAFYSQFNVLTDVNKRNDGSITPRMIDPLTSDLSRQELLYRVTTTPEPASIVLMLTGMAGIAGIATKRRRA